jgi:ADP-heptose:LPS heptosyltransferase
MKILVLSLLRLGDIVISSGALKGLKEKYPSCELHLAMNKQFSGIAPLLPAVDRFHLFDREKIQESLNMVNRPLFEASDRLEDFLTPLKREEFDLVINLTQNKLSGWLQSLIPAEEKLGLHFREDGSALFGSPWFRHLNRWGKETGGPQFHFADVLFNGAVGSDQTYAFDLTETSSGIAEAKTIIGTTQKFITVQLQTNDEKKNWSLNHFYQAIDTFLKVCPQYEVLLLCSPSEVALTRSFASRFSGCQVRVAECSMEGLYSVLKRSSLLLTGDTAVKHFACAAMTPIVELSIGSSHYFQTGSYLADSVIVQSAEPCAPCHHRNDCSKPTHLCSERVPGDLVGLICSKLLIKDWQSIKIISDEMKGHADLFRVAKMGLGHWTAVPLTTKPTPEYLDQLFDRISWRLLLNGEHHKSLGQIGSTGRRLGEFFERYFSSYDREDITLRLFQLESTLDRLEAKIDIFLVDFQAVLKRFTADDNLSQFQKQLADYSMKLSQDPMLATYANTLEPKGEPGQGKEKFVSLRRIRESLFDVKHRCQLEAKLIRSVKNYMEKHV